MSCVLLYSSDNDLRAVTQLLLESGGLHVFSASNESQLLGILSAVQCSTLIVAEAQDVNVQAIGLEALLWQPTLKIVVLTSGPPIVESSCVEKYLYLPCSREEILEQIQSKNGDD